MEPLSLFRPLSPAGCRIGGIRLRAHSQTRCCGTGCTSDRSSGSRACRGAAPSGRRQDRRNRRPSRPGRVREKGKRNSRAASSSPVSSSEVIGLPSARPIKPASAPPKAVSAGQARRALISPSPARPCRRAAATPPLLAPAARWGASHSVGPARRRRRAALMEQHQGQHDEADRLARKKDVRHRNAARHALLRAAEDDGDFIRFEKPSRRLRNVVATSAVARMTGNREPKPARGCPA